MRLGLSAKSHSFIGALQLAWKAWHHLCRAHDDLMLLRQLYTQDSQDGMTHEQECDGEWRIKQAEPAQPADLCVHVCVFHIILLVIAHIAICALV